MSKVLREESPGTSSQLVSVAILCGLAYRTPMQCWFISQPHSVGEGQALPSFLPLILETLNGGLAVVMGSSIPSSWALTTILLGQCLRVTPSSGFSGLMVSLQPPEQSHASSSPEMFSVQRHPSQSL